MRVREENIQGAGLHQLAQAVHAGPGIQHHAALGQHETGRVPELVGMVAGGAEQVQSHVGGLSLLQRGNPQERLLGLIHPQLAFQLGLIQQPIQGALVVSPARRQRDVDLRRVDLVPSQRIMVEQQRKIEPGAGSRSEHWPTGVFSISTFKKSRSCGAVSRGDSATASRQARTRPRGGRP